MATGPLRLNRHKSYEAGPDLGARGRAAGHSYYYVGGGQ
jgi:hypothetical protein